MSTITHCVDPIKRTTSPLDYCVSTEPLEEWCSWRILPARVSWCGKLHPSRVNATTGAFRTGARGRSCDSLGCRTCGVRLVTRVLTHFAEILVPLPTVWVAFCATSTITTLATRNIAQRCRRRNAQLKVGEPLVEWACVKSWNGRSIIIATEDLGGGWSGPAGHVSGYRAYDMLRRTSARLGVIDHWPTGSPGWRIAKGAPQPDGPSDEISLGDHASEATTHYFQLAADEIEQRYGVRPASFGILPETVPIDAWIATLRKFFLARSEAESAS